MFSLCIKMGKNWLPLGIRVSWSVVIPGVETSVSRQKWDGGPEDGPKPVTNVSHEKEILGG